MAPFQGISQVFQLTLSVEANSLGAMDEQNSKLSFTQRWTPKVLREAKTIFKEQGLRGVIRRFGWKVFALFFIYYLVRDVTLYIFLPWYLASKIL